MGEVSEPEPAGDGGHHFSPEQFSQEPDPFSFGIELAGNEGELRTESPFTDSFPDILQDAKGPLVSDFQTDAAEEIASLPEDSPAPEAEGISFAEFSFDEEKYEEQEYLQIGPASATPATADAGKNDSTKLEPMEFLFNDFEFVSEEPSVNKNETIETVDPIGFGEVLLEDISEGQAEGQEEIDTMGLSVEEYESLFGELPPRRKVN
ncbi:hypothetical protein [Geobacter sp. DSM 9736]|uniref:hypothetical protein n=1 Tax=Geobacter sp. DSM 9736 TaxID=1277350 RepID=UPI001560A26F|nr:hypothetical protein [Geobacter sp. DSM 9736]